MNVFLQKSGTRQGYQLSPILFNIAPEVLTREIIEENEIKAIHIKGEELKLFPVVGDIMVYLENPKKATETLIELSKEFSKV